MIKNRRCQPFVHTLQPHLSELWLLILKGPENTFVLVRYSAEKQQTINIFLHLCRSMELSWKRMQVLRICLEHLQNFIPKWDLQSFNFALDFSLTQSPV